MIAAGAARAVSRVPARAANSRKWGGRFNPLTLFIRGEQGVHYDPNDLSAEKVRWRRNLLTYSNQFDNTAWTKSNVTVARVGDDAFKVTEDTANAQHVVFENTAYTLAADAYTASVEAKAAERSFIRIQIETPGGVVYAGARFNLTTGQVVAGDVVVVNGATAPVARIAATQDGFYRVELTATLPAGALARCTVRLLPSESGFSYMGDGVSGLFIKNAQFELGAVASPYQKITDFNTEFMQAFPNHALFQDSAGTTPVTAAGQPVGLMLDKSKGLQLGPELVANGAWTAEAGAVTDGTLHTLDFQFEAVRQTASLINGRWYRLRYRVVSVSGAFALSLSSGGFTASTTVVPQAIGWNEVTVLCANASLPVRFIQPNAGTAIVFGDISVRELPGNHAFQSTAASRPMLRQSPILGSELLADSNNPATWVTASATVTSDSGGIRITNSGAFFGNVQRSFPTVVGATYRVAAAYRTGSPAGTGSLNIGTSAGGNQILSGVSASADRVFVATTTTTHVTYFAGGNTVGNYSVYANISVREITGYYTDRNYLEVDGSDDWMSTAPIDFTGTDKVSVFTGVRKLSDATSAMVYELSASLDANNGTFYLRAPSVNSQPYINAASKGTSGQATTNTAVPAPISAVVSHLAAINPPQVLLRVNGATTSTTATQGTGNYGNYPLYLFRRAGTILPFSGHFYGLTIVGRLTTNAETRNVERLYANKTGVTLA